eukprot:3566575-Amphidinium_carterae.1
MEQVSNDEKVVMRLVHARTHRMAQPLTNRNPLRLASVTFLVFCRLDRPDANDYSIKPQTIA